MVFMEMVEIMKNKENKIIYFYQNGRKSRLKENVPYAKEMFYGYHHFEKKGYDTEIIEFGSQKTLFGKYFFLIIEKRLRNILKLPLYWSFVTNKINYKKICQSKYLIFANNRMACSVLPMVVISKIFGNTFTSLSFVMGLFSRTPKYKILISLQKIYTFLTLYFIDKFIFLSEGEFNYASNNYPKLKNKFYHFPFSVDLEIWKNDNSQKNDEILFVGNDGNRDFELAELISTNMSNAKFTFVSEEINKSNTHKNSRIFSGSWGNPKIDDIELRELYQKSKLTIIPLKNSLQPSGQSVALQSIACGTPVLITKTEGFWDTKNFQDQKNIFFAKNNDLSNWIDKIKNILEMDSERIGKVISNGIETVYKHYDLNEFSKKIEAILLDRK